MIETDGDLGLILLEEYDKELLYDGTILYSESKYNNFKWIYGFCPPSEGRDTIYHPVVGFGSKYKDKGNKRYFVKLERGALKWTGKPTSTSTKEYVASKLFASFPKGTDNHYGVFGENHNLNREATISAFGFTFEELTKLLKAYNEVFGMNRYREVRITFSGTRNNDCELTGNTIPRNFPYITLSEPWSHISLFGFYSHLSLLMNNGDQSVIYEVMIKSGCPDELLKRLMTIPYQLRGSQVCLRNY